jgi:hypothetical protein
MIALDEQQDRLLRDVAEIIGRAAARHALRRLRTIATAGLTYGNFSDRGISSDGIAAASRRPISGPAESAQRFCRSVLMDTGKRPKRAVESRKPGKPRPNSHIARHAVTQGREASSTDDKRKPAIPVDRLRHVRAMRSLETCFALKKRRENIRPKPSAERVFARVVLLVPTLEVRKTRAWNTARARARNMGGNRG